MDCPCERGSSRKQMRCFVSAYNDVLMARRRGNGNSGYPYSRKSAKLKASDYNSMHELLTRIIKHLVEGGNGGAVDSECYDRPNNLCVIVQCSILNTFVERYGTTHPQFLNAYRGFRESYRGEEIDLFYQKL